MDFKEFPNPLTTHWQQILNFELQIWQYALTSSYCSDADWQIPRSKHVASMGFILVSTLPFHVHIHQIMKYLHVYTQSPYNNFPLQAASWENGLRGIHHIDFLDYK